jgi:hypothetical protein
MQNQQEDELLKAFRGLDPKFKKLVLQSVKSQAERCEARRPKLRLVTVSGGVIDSKTTGIAKNA